MTFGEMKDLIANRLGDTSANTKTRIGEFINDIMFRISDDVQYPGEVRWGQIRTESGRFSYPLDPDVASIIEPMIVSESNANIWMTPVETFNANIQNPTSTGVPHNFMLYGNYGVERQPSSLLTFSDPVTAATATIYGMVDFRNISESLVLTTGTTTDSVNSFTTVDQISLDVVPGGTVTVLANTIKIAEFTTSEKDAASSAYGLYNPASLIFIGSSAEESPVRDVTITGYGPLMSSSTVVVQDSIYLEETIENNSFATPGPSANRYTTVESISVDAETDGIISATSDPSTQRIATIPPKKRSLDIPIVGFYPIPNGSKINYQYYRTLTPLTIDSSRPSMDQRVHYYIRKWAETAVNSWYGDSAGVSETIQNAIPSWRQDMQAIRDILGLSANPNVVIGGRARNISRKYGPSAMLDPSHYSN